MGPGKVVGGWLGPFARETGGLPGPFLCRIPLVSGRATDAYERDGVR
jgi:hypothetical protein